jgi:excisionase family DNA binding protein
MQILSTKALAERWRVSDAVVRALIADGVVPAAKHGGRLGVSAAAVAVVEGVPGPLHPGPLMTAEEVATVAPYKPATVKVYARQRLIPSCRIGGQRRFRRDAIDAWLAGAFDPSQLKKHGKNEEAT